MPEDIPAELGEDLTNLGMSFAAHDFLKRLKTEGAINEMADGYRLGVALAVASRADAGSLPDRVNVFGVASIDPAGQLRAVVESEYGNRSVTPYRMVERLADWGIRELERRFDGQRFDLSGILGEVE